MREHYFTIFGPQILAAVVQDNIFDSLPFAAQTVNQVHGVRILDVKELVDSSDGYDAMVSKEPGIKLMIKTADCIPLVFADEEAGIIAASHAGWKSLVADIIPLTIERLIEMGASAERIKVGMGPSLGTCCSEFSNPKEEIPEKYHWAILENNHVDLINIALKQLSNSNIAEENIERMAICTACSPGWFSWRRNKTDKRMGTYIEMIKSV